MKTRDLPERQPEPRPVALAKGLRRLAADLDTREPPSWATLDARLPRPLSALAAVAVAAPASSAATRWRARLWPRWPAAGLAMVSVAAMALLLAVFSGSQPAASGPGEFVVVAGAERWLRLGSEGGAAWLVQTELPQERLAAYGLPYDPGRAAMPVRAELLMRASGEVLALRIVD